MSGPTIASLRKLDISTLESLAGTTIVRAVSSAYDTNRSKPLAQLIVDRFGVNLLKQKEVRRCLVDALSSDKARALCAKLKISHGREIGPNRALQLHFDKGFTRARAQSFVAGLGLSEELIPPVAEDTRSASEELTVAYGETASLRGFLHPYQKRVKDEVLESVLHEMPRQMVQMPTGSGKTATALEVAIDVLRTPNFDGIVTWIVESNDLAEQAFNTFKELWRIRGDAPVMAYRYFGSFVPDLSIQRAGIVFAGFPKLSADLSAKDAAHRRSAKDLCRRNKLLIVDEAHSSIAETYEPVVQALVEYGAPLVGLTATPGRNDDVSQDELAKMFGKRLISLRDDSGKEVDDAIGYLRAGRYLAQVEFEELTSGASSQASRESALCTELAENSERNSQIVQQIEKSIALEQPVLVFACTKDHVFALVALCRSRAIETGFIVGETPPSERNSMMDRFRAGHLKVIINHEILSTGIDLPNVRRLIITRPVGSPILYSQIVGRALRGPLNGGRETNTVVNIRDNLDNFPSASHVYEAFRMSFSVSH
jgi:DNA repair protein RadD